MATTFEEIIYVLAGIYEHVFDKKEYEERLGDFFSEEFPKLPSHISSYAWKQKKIDLVKKFKERYKDYEGTEYLTNLLIKHFGIEEEIK